MTTTWTIRATAWTNRVFLHLSLKLILRILQFLCSQFVLHLELIQILTHLVHLPFILLKVFF